MVTSELEILHSIFLWANTPLFDDAGFERNNVNAKRKEARKLMRHVKVAKMEYWEIEFARKYPFVRNVPSLVDAFMKRIF